MTNTTTIDKNLNLPGIVKPMAIVVEKHTGEIEVNSTLGQGTQFIILLPINK